MEQLRSEEDDTDFSKVHTENENHAHEQTHDDIHNNNDIPFYP